MTGVLSGPEKTKVLYDLMLDLKSLYDKVLYILNDKYSARKIKKMITLADDIRCSEKHLPVRTLNYWYKHLDRLEYEFKCSIRRGSTSIGTKNG